MIGRAVLSALAFGLSAAATRADTVDGGRYGLVEVAAPEGGARGYVVLFSDPDRPVTPMDLHPLTREGALVVAVDTRAYFANIRRDGKACDQLVGDAETLSRQLQRLYPTLEYTFPILAGLGAGGTLAYATLAQAPDNTLAGAIAVDPAPSIGGIPTLCPGAPSVAEADGRQAYGAKPGLRGFWSVAFDTQAPAAGRAWVAALADHGAPATQSEAVSTDAVATVAALVAPHLGAPAAGGIADIPLVELPADEPGPLMAVVMSGDGGWRDIDRTIAETLRHQGISVLGWDSLRYFWHERTPDETAADLIAVLRTYAARWKAEKIALIGYSFGADVLPFLYDRLPLGLRGRVAQVSLLGLEAKADWEISVRGWLGGPPSDAATPLAPAVTPMPGDLIQCFYGEQETDSACPTLPGRDVERIKTAGGHHFGNNYVVLTERIMAGFRRRAAR